MPGIPDIPFYDSEQDETLISSVKGNVMAASSSCWWIKPSWKAKHATGLNSSDAEESNDGLEGEPANTGSKHKVGKKASSASTKKKQKPNEVPKTKQARKRAHADSKDVESTDEMQVTWKLRQMRTNSWGSNARQIGQYIEK